LFDIIAVFILTVINACSFAHGLGLSIMHAVLF